MNNSKPLFKNTMIALSLQHVCFIATVSVAKSQNTFSATTLTEMFGYTRKNLTTCSKSANKPSTSCVRTACYNLSTSLEQAVNNL